MSKKNFTTPILGTDTGEIQGRAGINNPEWNPKQELYTRKEKPFKICCTGTSGSGKTTLSKIIQEMIPELKFIPGSADLILNDKDRNFLKAQYNYEPQGHRNVIMTSMIKPDFGYQFQFRLLRNRALKLINESNFITDRSPVDNVTYLLDQVSLHLETNTIDHFIDHAVEVYQELTHLIYIRPVQPHREVEYNGSRVNNWWYQQKVDAIFNDVLQNIFMKRAPEVPVLILDYWDLEQRTEAVRTFLK